MTWKRILRDGLIVAALCAAFYFSANAIDSFAEPEGRVYSMHRRLADQHYSKGQWEQAIYHFQKLTEQDKFNGYAWFQLAVCQLGLRADLVKDIETMRDQGTSEEELVTLESKQKQLEDQVIESLVRSSEFLRHRRRSLVNLAIIYTGRGDWDIALDYLDTYIEEGYLLTRSLEHISSLGVGGRGMVEQTPQDDPDVGLHRFPKFWQLVDIENQKRRGIGHQPMIRGQIP